MSLLIGFPITAHFTLGSGMRDVGGQSLHGRKRWCQNWCKQGQATSGGNLSSLLSPLSSPLLSRSQEVLTYTYTYRYTVKNRCPTVRLCGRQTQYLHATHQAALRRGFQFRSEAGE
ncbi:hypothetical protein LX36DRAFT_167770 [Colletotrichum falcatum]|nr:hypothetical protein LX36DRAFT_167770 [Colletotrichum falcatum]